MNNILDTQIFYNGVSLPFIRTEEFRQEPWWSSDGTDLLGLHFTIAVSGILHNSILPGNMDPAEWVEQARYALLQRGGQLFMYIGGTLTLPATTTGNTSAPITGNELVSSPNYYTPDDYTANAREVVANQDANLGPRPISFDIRQIKGGAYAYLYRIETWVPYCASNYPSTESLPAAILSNRWESSVDIDRDYFYTRTTTGVLVINGQYLSDAQPAAAVLAATAATLIFPPLFNNWKREVVRFTLSSDQLTLTYVIQDRALYVALPRPASSIEATYSEVMPPQGGGGIAMLNLQQVNMDVTVSGDPNTQIANSFPTVNGMTGITNPDRLKWTLLQIAFNLIFQRFPFSSLFTATGGNFAANTMITHFEMREDIMRPIVGCRIVGFKARPTVANALGSAATWESTVFAATQIGQPVAGPAVLSDIFNQIASYPVSQANWATFLLLASVDPHGPCAGGEIPEIAGQFYPFQTLVYSTQISTAQTNIGTAYQTNVNLSVSEANYQYPFTDYTATVDFVNDNHTIQLPVMYDVEQSPPGTTQASSVFCQTASPTSRKIIRWKASRLGAWPKAPAPNAVDVYGGGLPSDKVLNTSFQTGEVELSNDALTRHYSISGVYEIGMARRWQWDVASTVLSTITNPVIGSSFYGDADASYPTNNFITGLLNAGPSPGNLLT